MDKWNKKEMKAERKREGRKGRERSLDYCEGEVAVGGKVPKYEGKSKWMKGIRKK